MIAALWLITVVGGAWCLTRYSATPGPAINPDALWPVADSLPRRAGVDTLVMTLHPDCPCSHASVDELEVLMTRCHGRLNAIALFSEPPGLAEDSATTGLWQSASRIPGVICRRDHGGELSARLGAQTSGQVFLYDASGVLRFNGGITTSRGHDGDSDGLNAITAIVSGADTPVKQTRVFGCSLR
jgi:hypothetical protein